MQIDILGSCVCRDLFRYMPEELYSVERCIGNIPISTLYEKRVSLEKRGIDLSGLSKYNYRMLKIQMGRSAVSLLKKSEANVLILDLADECMKRFVNEEISKCGIAFQEEEQSIIEEGFSEYGESIIMDALELNWEELEEKYRRFALDLVKTEENPNGYYAENIVVLETYYAEKKVGNSDGILHPQPAEYKIREKNEFLRKLYQILYRYIPECHVVKLPIFTHSVETHLRGEHPLYYTEDTYIYLAKVLRTLFKELKVNTVENLYLEQGFKNKLFTRVLNSSSINSIAGMKKEIATLQKQVKELSQKLEEIS